MPRKGKNKSVEEIVETFLGVRRHIKNGVNAPHKPLLMLLALGRLLKGEKTVEFEKVEPELKKLIQRYGPGGSRPNALYPFRHLSTDGIWVTNSDGDIRENASGDYVMADVREYGLRGGFSPEIAAQLGKNPKSIFRIADSLVKEFFPESLHAEILERVGLTRNEDPDDLITRTSRRRDPAFPVEVLSFYDNRCCFCGFDGRDDTEPFGIEAAHIRWHAKGGDSNVSNGLALCRIHHVSLDLGLWTIGRNFEILLSDRLGGQSMIKELFRNFKGENVVQRAKDTTDKVRVPDMENIKWHWNNIFKGEV